MDFISQFAHAGHVHAETSDDMSVVILFGGIVAAVVITAVVLIVVNGRNKPAVEPADDINK